MYTLITLSHGAEISEEYDTLEEALAGARGWDADDRESTFGASYGIPLRILDPSGEIAMTEEQIGFWLYDHA